MSRQGDLHSVPSPRPRPRRRSAVAAFMGASLVFGLAVLCTLAVFLVLPLLQAITAKNRDDMVVRSINTGVLEAPPPTPEEPEEPEETEPEPPPPPDIPDAPQNLSLDQLESALSPGFGGGFGSLGPGGLQLRAAITAGEGSKGLFDLADLDQKPRATSQTPPQPTARTRAKAPGSAWIIFIVDRDGRVRDARVQRSTDTVFEAPALAAVKRWRFEPGKRNGEPVEFRVRQKISF